MLPVRHFPQPSLTWLLASGPFETLEWEGVCPSNHPSHHFSLAKLASNTRLEMNTPTLFWQMAALTHLKLPTKKPRKKITQTPANTCKSWKLITWGNFWATRFHRFPPYQNCAFKIFKDFARGWTRKSSVSGFGVWALPRKKHPGTRLKLPKHPANTQYCHKHPFVDHKHPMDVPPILCRKFLRGFINYHKLHLFPRLWIFRDLIWLNLVDYKLGDRKALSIQKTIFESLKFSRFQQIKWTSQEQRNHPTWVVSEVRRSESFRLIHRISHIARAIDPLPTYCLAQRALPVLVHRIPLWKFLSTVVYLGDENGKFLRITLDTMRVPVIFSHEFWERGDTFGIIWLLIPIDAMRLRDHCHHRSNSWSDSICPAGRLTDLTVYHGVKLPILMEVLWAPETPGDSKATWAMVNTHYMVDGHPIHNKDPYNGYYKSLWTIGWLAPINGS